MYWDTDDLWPVKGNERSLGRTKGHKTRKKWGQKKREHDETKK